MTRGCFNPTAFNTSPAINPTEPMRQVLIGLPRSHPANVQKPDFYLQLKKRLHYHEEYLTMVHTKPVHYATTQGQSINGFHLNKLHI
jgi:hypothetical protein